MEDSTRPIRIVVIDGSFRPNNYTRGASGRAEPSVPGY